MSKNLVIVESPAKAKTIEGFLGKDYVVKSCFGHVRDLSKTGMGIDLANRYKPLYEIPEDKKAIISELKKLAKSAETILLASDEDREGEAISWHLFDTLGLKKDNTRRIVFHEITKPAILKAIENPRGINYNLVNAQQARRVLDRLVGFELSPVLWKKIKSNLSAGRVQSVAVRLLVDREREIMAFQSQSSYKVTALFKVSQGGKTYDVEARLPVSFSTEAEALAFIEKCRGKDFSVASVEKKPAKRTPSAPFTTSTLQQEAARKLGFSVLQTMTIAQKLYEAGKITYMRTDSVNLSDTALAAAETQVKQAYGEKFHKTRKFTTKSKGAQEAHEAIRPTYFEQKTLSGGDNNEKRLYELIWKRAIASQMADAELEKTAIRFVASGLTEAFEAHGEVVVFEGFLKVYVESNDEGITEDDEAKLLPPLKVGDIAMYEHITATQKFSAPPPRYTEASLVKKMEELGIGRPSTYAPTISVIQKREYVEKGDREAKQRVCKKILLKGQEIAQSTFNENYGSEKAKLFPTDMGMVVNDFLLSHFAQILDFNFTAKVEKEFDDIAEGLKDWTEMIDRFYGPFHRDVEKTLEQSDRARGVRLVGVHPENGKNIYARIGRYGPIVQIGENDDDDKKFANLRKGMLIENISVEDALDLFKLPRSIGEYEDAEMVVAIGRFGPFIRHKNAFYSIPKTDDPYTIEPERAVTLIEAKRKADKEKLIKTFAEDAELQVLNGRFGPYINKGKENFKIPKDKNPATLSYADCLSIMETPQVKAKPRRAAKSKK